MTLERHIELITTKNITLLNPTMEEMIYWSQSNIFVFINLKCIVKSDKIDQKYKLSKYNIKFK
jgi:hypothetical protein